MQVGAVENPEGLVAKRAQKQLETNRNVCDVGNGAGNEARIGLEQISDPAIASDTTRLIALAKEQGKLKSLVGKYREYKTAVSGIEDAEQIINDSSADEDFRALAKEEFRQLEGKTNALLERAREGDSEALGELLESARPGVELEGGPNQWTEADVLNGRV